LKCASRSLTTPGNSSSAKLSPCLIALWLKSLLKILSQPGPTLRAGFFIDMCAEEAEPLKRRRRKDIFATE
jgi:hypothetical protein